ncbi:hypothetical protein [Moorella sp. ACPs]|uniref:hypothetical protein n=1 Tax=Neomoorella carbonis TaxID=3062783 RepID=UPI0032535CB2
MRRVLPAVLGVKNLLGTPVYASLIGAASLAFPPFSTSGRSLLTSALSRASGAPLASGTPLGKSGSLGARSYLTHQESQDHRAFMRRLTVLGFNPFTFRIPAETGGDIKAPHA